MIVLEDTRNQVHKHDNIHRYFNEHEIEFRRTKLYVGDYIIANRGDVAIDTKKDVMELITDLHKDHKRFRDECLRAQEAGIELIVLTEELLPGGRLENWKSPRKANGQLLTTTDPAVLRKMMITMQSKYSVKFRFCSPDSTGSEIMRYLRSEDKRE